MVFRWLFGNGDEEVVNDDGDWKIVDNAGNERKMDEDEKDRAFKHVHNEGVADSKGWNRPDPSNVDDHGWW